MVALLRHHPRTARRATAGIVGCAAALALAACGEPGPTSEERHAAEPGEVLVAVPGYDYTDSQADPTAAAVVEAYESWSIMPPPVRISEDFESGAGPFKTWTTDTAAAELAAGALRITNSDPEFAMDSYAWLGTEADNVLVTSTLTTSQPLAAREGPGLVVSRWGPDFQDLKQEYQFNLDGQTAFLSGSQNLDEARLLDSAQVPPGLKDEVEMGLWVYARGESTFVVGYLDGERIVDGQAAAGVFDTVALRTWSAGTPRIVDFQRVDVGVQAVGEDLPALFTAQSEHTVEQDGAPVATITVLDTSSYVRDYQDLEGQETLPAAILEQAATAGMTVGGTTLAGEAVVQGALSGVTFWVWTHEQRWYVATAADAAVGSAFVAAHITEEHGGDPGGDASADVLLERDYSAVPDGAVETTEQGTTQVLDGALIITPSTQDEPMTESWPLPADAQSVTLTAMWGAPSGAEDPVGIWMLEVWGRNPNAGIWLACWSDGTPVELVDMASRQVLATAPDGECGSAQSMTLTIDNSIEAPYSLITFQGGDSPATAFIGDTRYPLDQAGYRVSAEEPGFSVALESLTIEVD